MKLLTQLKEEFRAWCGRLSIDEIMSNPGLVEGIERLERMLLAFGA